MTWDPTHPPGCECDTCCDCPKCKARRGESIYPPAPDQPADAAGASVRIMEGVTDPAEVAALALLAMPFRGVPTRQAVARQVADFTAKYSDKAPPVSLDEALRAVDSLLACGLLVEGAGGALEITDLVYALKRRDY